MKQQVKGDTASDWARIWALRALVYGKDEGPHRNSTRLMRYFGLPERDSAGGPRPEPDWEALREAAERERPPKLGTLFANVDLLRSEFDLAEPQADLIALRALASLDAVLEESLCSLTYGNRLTRDTLVEFLSAVLAVPGHDVRAMLDPRGVMVSSGLLNLSDQLGNFWERVGLTIGLVDSLHVKHDGLESLLAFALQEAKPGTLGPEDFRHLAGSLELATALVRSASEKRRKGAGILLHGLPGTGKTEMATLIARQCGLKLFVVPGEIGTHSGRDRLLRLRFMHHLCGRRRKAAVLFDEAEDAWPRSGGIGGANSPHTDKGSLVDLLESLSMPVIWVSNAVHQIDSALLRRFDMILEVKPPTRRARADFARKALPSLECDGATLESLVEDDSLTPGVISRYGSSLVDAGLADGQVAGKRFEQLVDGWLNAVGRPRTRAVKPALEFEPAFLNASVDLTALASRLSASGRGRLLLHGPPGTGKSAYADYLAREADRPLHRKRGSDLLSKWIGETEHRIAAMFGEAERDGAVLLLDEADGFLRDRRGASRSWEVTQVNELLTQMEAFDGLFVCTTNLMEDIDRAAMRRFHYKVALSALLPLQRVALFWRIAPSCSDPDLVARIESRIRSMSSLTAGDFAIAADSLSVANLPATVEAVVEALEEASGSRHDRPIRIGFR